MKQTWYVETILRGGVWEESMEQEGVEGEGGYGTETFPGLPIEASKRNGSQKGEELKAVVHGPLTKGGGRGGSDRETRGVVKSHIKNRTETSLPAIYLAEKLEGRGGGGL